MRKENSKVSLRPLCGVLLLVLFAVVYPNIIFGSNGGNDILTPDERLWLKNNTPITLAIETTYAPFVFLNTNGQPTGLAHDYISLIQSKLGFHFEQKQFLTLNDILEQVQNGEIQIINAVTKTPARSEYISFTEPYISVPNVIITGKSKDIKTKNINLSGLKVSLVKSYAITEYLVNKGLGFFSDLVPDDLTALLHVSFGVSDAAVIDLATASYLIENKGITNLQVAGETDFNIQLAMGTAKAETMLFTILQKGLAAITEAEKREINKRWIDVSDRRFFFDSRFWMVTGGILLIVLAIISAIVFWNLALQKLVDARTRALADEKEALRESERRYRNIFDNVLETFYEVNFEGVILDISPSVFHLSKGQYTREELLGTSLLNFYADIVERESLLRELHQKDQVSNYEIKLKNLDGSIVICSISSKIQRDENNKPMKIIGTIVDITDRKKVEEERKHLESQLRQAQKLEAIGTLAGGIAHDFNNILGAIVGYSEIIRDDMPPDSPSIHDIEQVLKASHRAKDLVKQILAFSRQVNDQKVPLQPAAIVKEAIALLRSSLPTTISIKQDIDAESGMVLADPTQIHQVVMNLATNAFHAMEAKGGTLTIAVERKVFSHEDLVSEPDLQPGVYVQLLVKDTGDGIPPEIRDKIFDPFFTTKEVGKGTGLGLSMVYSIIKSCHGAITCNSRIGEGTEFCIILPAEEGYEVQETNGSTTLIPQGKEHILLIDDEEMLVEMGQSMLERLGYHVTTRRTSLDALTTFQNQPDDFDLIITDQTMPGMTGIDLARRILQIRPEKPIILCTGYSSQVTDDKAKTAGIKGFAYKPLAKKEIGELIRKVLDEKNYSLVKNFQ